MPQGIMSFGNNGNGGGVDVSSLIASLKKTNDSANADSLAQYNNLLNSVAATKKSIIGKGGQFSQAANLLTKQGETAKADTQDAINNNLGQITQDMMNRGLGNTTIRQSVLAGAKMKGQRELNNIDEQTAAARAALLERQANMTAQLGNLEADSILSRQNDSSSMQQYMDLIARLSAAQAGGQSRGPQKITSTMGSINAVNTPVQFNNAYAAGGNTQAPTTGGYITGSGFSGGATTLRPGDTLFGATAGTLGGGTTFGGYGGPYAPGYIGIKPTDDVFSI